MPKAQLTGKQSDFLKIVVAAAGRGDLEAVCELVDEKPNWIHTVGSHGRTMLWEASYRGKKNVVRFLVERGADVHICGCHYTPHRVEISPYCVAKLTGRDAVANYLQANGARVDIHTAAYLGDYKSVVVLLDADPSLLNQGHPQHDMGRGDKRHLGFYTVSAAWATPVCYAIVGGHREIVELLISRGATIKPYSKQLLGFAVGGNHVDLVQFLLENGTDPNKTPQVMADRHELLGLLKSYGVMPADINTSNKMGWPPLVYASRGDKGEHPEEVQRLLNLGANVDVRNYKGKTALHCAAKAGFVRVIEVLLKNRVDVNATDKNGETPLFEAIRSTIKKVEKKVEVTSLLLSNGALINHGNHKGETPLKLAQRSRRQEASEILRMLESLTIR